MFQAASTPSEAPRRGNSSPQLSHAPIVGSSSSGVTCLVQAHFAIVVDGRLRDRRAGRIVDDRVTLE
jgi:hypothetical protein